MKSLASILIISAFQILFVAAASAQTPAATGTEAPAPAAESETHTLSEPFTFADFSWAPGNYGPPDSFYTSKYFTPEIRLDESYHYSFNNPVDDTISGSSEVFRHNEFQTTQIGVGGDFHYRNVGFRLMTQYGMYSSTTPRNDSSPSRGQWDLTSAYKYISEAYASYHIDVLHGINIQSGIFMSYVGLWSYYNFDNWTYQPSYVSSNTPWFFNGMRAQIFPTERLKIEPWLVNGWQSYGKFNNSPGLGMQILYRPTDSVSMLGNQYYGTDTLGNANRRRFHTDDSVMVKYYENQSKTVSKAAFSLTLDAGCETGGGVNCGNQYFLGLMAYNRLWFDHDHFGFTFGGGAINNPGRYLVLLPPINGATSASGSANFSESPGDTYNAWDSQITGDWMPNRNITFRLEYNYRWASVPYFSGSGGVTPPGGNQGAPGSQYGTWAPDLTQAESRVTAAMMIRL